MKRIEIIIKDTHRGLWYEDGVLTRVLEAGRYEIPKRKRFFRRKGPLVEVILVDMRERDLTIKGQEILTSDKVALRVSIIVQFRVVDPKLAMHAVEKYEDRLYSDVQLAALPVPTVRPTPVRQQVPVSVIAEQLRRPGQKHIPNHRVGRRALPRLV